LRNRWAAGFNDAYGYSRDYKASLNKVQVSA
jgi:hypothetical protein